MLRTKKEAKEILVKIKAFLEKELKLQLNTKTQIFKDKQGVNFCGYKINENRLKIRNKGKRKLKRKIKDFLKENLELELNKKTQIFKSKQGVNFCGYKINEYRLKIRDKGKRKLKKKVKRLKEEIKQGNMTSKIARKYLAGHLGYIKIANTKNLIDKIFYTET